jgi:hypothetical protein
MAKMRYFRGTGIFYGRDRARFLTAFTGISDIGGEKNTL